MQRCILLRLVHAVVVILVVSVIIFGMSRLTGNPADVLLPPDATQAEVDYALALRGLDRPLHVQYFTFLGNALRGDFGVSIRWRGESVLSLVLSRLPATLQLASFALLISVLMAVPIGVIAAVKKDTGIDYGAKLIALPGQSLPSFWVELVLMWIFAVHLGWLPTSGRGTFQHMILPAVALGWYQVAALARLTRSAMLDVLDSEYVKLARIKGLSERKVIWKHCLRNATIVPITYFGLVLGVFATGSVVIETVFSWPGVGLLAIQAIVARDFQVVQTVVIFFTGIYILSSLLVDITYAYLDPRVRYT